MPNFKTERAQILQVKGISIERKICHVASDYKRALKSPEFAKANGCTVEDLRHDLMIFIKQWEQSL